MRTKIQDTDLAKITSAYMQKVTLHFCSTLGVSEDVIGQIIYEKSDWAFFLKMDSLLETSAKDIILRNWIVERKSSDSVENIEIKKFVQNLNMDGKTSVLSLLKSISSVQEWCGFIRAVRQVRNQYAHDVKASVMLVTDLLDQHPDKQNIFLRLTPMLESEDRDELWDKCVKTPKLVRAFILFEAMMFLGVAYEVEYEDLLTYLQSRTPTA